MNDGTPIDWIADPTQLRRHMNRVKDANRAITQEGATYLALNYNRPAVTLSKSAGGGIIGFDALADLGFNVLAEAIRAGKSQIVQPLQPRVSPIGGTWDSLRACEGLGQVIDGVFDLCRFTRLAGKLVVHGSLCGEGYGIVDVDPIKKDFTCSRLDPLETFFNSDRTEVVTTRMISRRRALALYGKDDAVAAAIRACPRYTPDVLTEVDYDGQWGAEDNIAFYCAWAEPIGNEKGRHTIQLGDPDGMLLVNREWKYPLPVFSFQWDEGHRGENDSKPLGRTIAPMHYWLNKMVRKMHDALKAAVPIVVGETDPNWSDVPYQFIKVKPGEKPPTIEVPKTVSQDVRQAITDLREQIYRETGLSEEAAAGAAPPQYKSGVALSTWRKVVNESLNQQHQAYENVWTQAARIIVAMAPDVYKTKKARGSARGTEVIQQIDFSKVNLPEDSYSVSFDVVSDLPKHLPEKLELMGFMEEKGWVDGDEVLTHINVVDFRAAAKRRAGPRALIETQISHAINDGELIPPSEMQDFAKLAELAGQAYQSAMAQFIKPPRRNMQALLHLYLLAKARIQPAPAPALPAPAPGLAPPAPAPEVAPPVPPGVTAPPAEPLPVV